MCSPSFLLLILLFSHPNDATSSPLCSVIHFPVTEMTLHLTSLKLLHTRLYQVCYCYVVVKYELLLKEVTRSSK
jgi:hypothetical protein